MKARILSVGLVAALIAPAASGQEHVHSHGSGETLGTVHFPTSCRAVEAEFTRAVALLHSFGYAEARRAFEEVAAKDPACGIAQWGIAMTWYHPIWAPPTAAELAAGRAAAEAAARIGAGTDRERGYIAAIGTFYRDSGTVDHRARALAYRDAMEQLANRFPDDHEARIFYALSLLGSAPPGDAAFANQKKAAAILNGLLPEEPKHPGIAHYMIHAFDYPALAADALPAARAYAKIAPDSPHALHMPSHIFTRLGLWNESIASNLASAEAARQLVARRHPGAASFDALHALDYLEYAYLQIGDEAAARKVLEEAATAKTFDEPNFAAAYALTAIPARWTLERRDWKAAAALEPVTADFPWQNVPYARATTFFAQALGAARSGQLDRARGAHRGNRKGSRRAPERADSGPLRLDRAGGIHAPRGGRVARVRRGSKGRGPDARAIRSGSRREDGQAPRDARGGPAGARALRRHAARGRQTLGGARRVRRVVAGGAGPVQQSLRRRAGGGAVGANGTKPRAVPAAPRAMRSRLAAAGARGGAARRRRPVESVSLSQAPSRSGSARSAPGSAVRPQ